MKARRRYAVRLVGHVVTEDGEARDLRMSNAVCAVLGRKATSA